VPSGERRVNRTPIDPEVESQIWRVQGEEIVDGEGTKIQLRGIDFGNDVGDAIQIPSGHHTARDYARVAHLGFNTVRFSLHYRTFEDDDAPYEYKDSGFAWVDQNVEWARAQGIRLILNLGVPPGVVQSQNSGGLFWTDAELQNRFVELWRVLAERYRAEPSVAGFSLLNEPAPPQSLEQWQELAGLTVAGIREMNQHHMVFVERATAVAGDDSEAETRNFVLVEDPNVVYEFHFYKPFQFTHQNSPQNDSVAREGWYPDANTAEVEWYNLTEVAAVESPALPSGSSPWATLVTEAFATDDPTIAVARPVLSCAASGGTARFDRLTLLRMGPDKFRIKQEAKEAEEALLKLPKKQRPWLSPKQIEQKEAALKARLQPDVVFDIDLDTRRGWRLKDEGKNGVGEFTTEGNGDFTALAITAGSGPVSLESKPLLFRVEQGVEYRLKGIARGVSLSEKSNCLIRLQFYSSKVPILPRGKAFLEQELAHYLAWAKEKQVPLYLGAFGTIRDSFLPGRGGEIWVQDMLRLSEEQGLHFSYRAYHDERFGLFGNAHALPSDSSRNARLWEVFSTALSGADDAKKEPSAVIASEDERGSDLGSESGAGHAQATAGE